jgi:hypothetical protein
MKHGRIRQAFAALATTAALAGAVPAIAAERPAPAIATASKTCSRGFTHAVINGSQKCLRRGEFCAHSADSQYRRYGYHCTKYDARVSRYRLT